MRIFGILSNICREKHFIQLPFNGFVFWCASFPTQNEVFTICRQNISWNSSSTIVCNRFVCWFLCWDSNISHLNFLSINEIPTIWLAKIPVNSMTFLDYQDNGNVLSYFFLKAHADRHINIEISAKSHRKEWDGTLKKTPYQRFFFLYIFVFTKCFGWGYLVVCPLWNVYGTQTIFAWPIHITRSLNINIDCIYCICCLHIKCMGLVNCNFLDEIQSLYYVRVFFYNCHSCFLMLHSPIFSVSQFRRERVIYGFFVWFSSRGKKKNVKYNELTIIRQFKTHPNQMYVCGFYMISTHVFIGGTDMFFFELFSSWLLLSFSFQDPSTNSNSNINIFIKYILYIRSLLWYT